MAQAPLLLPSVSCSFPYRVELPLLTETEIFDQMSESFRLAVEACERLAVIPKKGRTYKVLVEHLSLLEGCCRQVAYFRGGDTRWLFIAKKMSEFHKAAGDWLRGTPLLDHYGQKVGPSLATPKPQIKDLFFFLANYLRKGEQLAWACKDQRTGRIGPILPVPVLSGAPLKYYPGTNVFQ